MVIDQEYVEIPVGGRPMRTFVAAPRADGRYPGVAFYTDIFQLTEPSLRWVCRLAGHGFVVAAPEIYYRVEPRGMKPLIDWIAHYRAFWTEHVDRLERLLEKMDG